MGDEGGGMPAPGGGGGGGGPGGTGNDGLAIDTKHPRPSVQTDDIKSPALPPTPNPFSRQQTSLDIDDYFTGPRDIAKHSKWPLFMQMHGSILPKMLLPLLWVGGWSTAVTAITELGVHNLGVNSVLLTITGFVVGLGLSFRSATAYERYAEGRRYWMQLVNSSQMLGRVFWVHAREVDAQKQKRHLLHVLTCSNLVVAFAIALKHKLRFEPYSGYDDLTNLVSHLETFASQATRADPEKMVLPRKNWFKEMGEYLGISFAHSNPRKALKKAHRPLGNLPLEILSYLGRYVDVMIREDKLSIPMQQTLAYNSLTALNDVLTGTERVLTTPLPIAYTIAISQITWVYITLLPFQLVTFLHWVTIPATIAASYIILGILFIGREIENPFGQDVNDLPLESYCDQVACELDVVASQAMELDDLMSHVENSENRVLFPVSSAPYTSWMMRSENKLRDAIRNKPMATFEARCHHKMEEKKENGDANV
jgi:ion channel-forming bestrophin family protein